jgi:hypothetical protein
MQLVAYGAQDVYMTNDPQITFWKRAYKRHTNFSVESIGQNFQGNVNFGSKPSCQISRNGDLIHKAYIQVRLPKIADTVDPSKVWVPWIGHALIESVDISIGGQTIDRHFGDWIHIWNELSGNNQDGYAKMVGKRITERENILYIPLNFWWNTSAGMALPLIALQYHEVRVNFNFAKIDKCLQSGVDKNVALDSTDLEAELYVDFVYIDTEERKRFAQSSHEYLIQQVQFTGDEIVRSSSTNITPNRVNLNFNHPCKELIWVVSDSSADSKFKYTFKQAKDNNFNTLTAKANELFSDGIDGIFGNDVHSESAGSAVPDTHYTMVPKLDDNGVQVQVEGETVYVQVPTTTGPGADIHVTMPTQYKGPVAEANIQLNGHDRISPRPGTYFNLVQPYQHHTNVPKNKGIYCYSFALEPESEQPTGSCNMSRIDNAVLNLKLHNHEETEDSSKTHNLKVFATNFNVLRIMGGMGGLAFAN